jgi:hypothetical protein
MLDINKMKLGKRPPRKDERTLQFANYVAGLPAPPPACSWFQGVTQWGMMLNDELGDCTCAAYGHGAQVVTLNSTIGEVTPPDVLILNLYERTCGYVPGEPNTDQGGVILGVLTYARQHALGRKSHPYPRHKKFPMLAFTEVNFRNKTHVQQAIQYFGVVDIGLQLPLSAQSQVGNVWTVVGNPIANPSSQPGSWGGHSVIVAAYDSTGLTCITWGQLQKMTWEFWLTYVDESYALLYKFWLSHLGPYQLTLDQLMSDLKAVTN